MTVVSPKDAWARHLVAERALVRVDDVLSKASLQYVLIKGMVSARTLYQDVSERPISDIDLRVVPGNLTRLIQVLADVGCKARVDSREYGARSFSIENMLVEVGVSIGPKGMCQLPIRALLERADTLSIGGRDVLVPRPLDHLLVACVNVFKDGLHLAFPWAIEDVRRGFMAKSFEEDAFVEVVKRAHARGLVRCVLDYLIDTGGEATARLRHARERLDPEGRYRFFSQAYRAVGRGPLRPVLSRCASDAPLDWPKAFGYSAWGAFVHGAARLGR